MGLINKKNISNITYGLKVSLSDIEKDHSARVNLKEYFNKNLKIPSGYKAELFKIACYSNKIRLDFSLYCNYRSIDREKDPDIITNFINGIVREFIDSGWEKENTMIQWQDRVKCSDGSSYSNFNTMMRLKDLKENIDNIIAKSFDRYLIKDQKYKGIELNVYFNNGRLTNLLCTINLV